ncbi:BspA family leucine-rich repeat surface protein [archaeon]|nr:MAG: BspA family leucine-rich repeat surface protein [archaeon]
MYLQNPPVPPTPPLSVATVSTGYVFATNDTLKLAVKVWCDKDARARAEREYGHISTWNTSQVTSMQALFRDKTDFNDDISTWIVSNVTNMDYMFYDAPVPSISP